MLRAATLGLEVETSASAGSTAVCEPCPSKVNEKSHSFDSFVCFISIWEISGHIGLPSTSHALRSPRHCIGLMWSCRSSSWMNCKSPSDSTPTLDNLFRRDSSFSSCREGNTANTARFVSLLDLCSNHQHHLDTLITFFHSN